MGLNVLTKIWLGIIFGVMVIWEIIIWPYTKWKENQKFKRRLKELKEKDGWELVPKYNIGRKR